jgi:hypothetical protein
LEAQENGWRYSDKKLEKMVDMLYTWDVEKTVAETTKACETGKWL